MSVKPSADPQQLAVRALSVNLLALVALLFLAIKSGELDLLTVSASAPQAHLWVLTPYVAPSDKLEIEVGAVGAMRTSFQEIVVNGPSVHRSFEGPGPDWSMTISGKATDESHASQTVSVRVPESAPVGQPLELSIAARVIEAKSTGESFDNVETSRNITVRVPIRSHLNVLALKIGSFLMAILWLVGGAIVVSRGYHGGFEPTPGWALASAVRNAKRGFATFSVLLVALYSFVSVIGFAHPLRDAVGLVGDGFTVGFVGLAVVLPLWLGRKLAGLPPLAPLSGSIEPLGASEKVESYRASAGPKGAIHAQSGLDRLMSLDGVTASKIPRGILVTVGGSFVRAPKTAVEVLFESDTLEAGKIGLQFNDTELVVRVAIALTDVLGPFALDLRRNNDPYRYVVDATSNASVIVKSFRSAQRSEIEREARRELLQLLEARVTSLKR